MVWIYCILQALKKIPPKRDMLVNTFNHIYFKVLQ